MSEHLAKDNSGKTQTARPLTREHMPKDFSLSLGEYTKGCPPEKKRIPDDYGPYQSMRGFEETYRNIIDYIVRITYRIWEGRDIEYIADTYSDSSRVYDDFGLQFGNQKIIADTYHTTGAFSDIELIADEIIWAGNDEIGFHTSHRTLIRGTNDGDSRYGPASNKTIDILVIANCVALENKIFLEHVLYNTSGLMLQLGLNLETMAAKLAAAPPVGWPMDSSTWQGLRKAASPEKPISVSSPIPGFDVDLFVRANMDKIWNKREQATLFANYRPNFNFLGPSNRKFTGQAAYLDFQTSLFQAFPDLEVQVDEVYWMGNEADGYRTSERWSATGTHRGGGIYGPATNGKVHLWGITQHEIVAGKIVKEWMLFNELDLMMQIARARHA